MRPRALVSVALHLRPANVSALAGFANWNAPHLEQNLRCPLVAPIRILGVHVGIEEALLANLF
jgi:hypothetical protein